MLTPGQAHDLQGADVLLPQIQADIILADKAYDADERVLLPLAEAGKTAVMPTKSNRKIQREYDKELYKARFLSKTCSSSSSNTALLQHSMTKPTKTSLQPFTPMLQSFCLIEDTL